MKRIILAIAVLVAMLSFSSAAAQDFKFDYSLLFDSESPKVGISKELVPLTYEQNWWMKKLTIERISLEAVFAQKPETDERLWTGMGLAAYLTPWGGAQVSGRLGLTSNIFQEPLNRTKTLWYAGVGIRF